MYVIEELWAYMMIDDDGDEGIPAVLMSGGVMMPLVGADAERLQLLLPLAQEVANHEGKPVTLLHFSGPREVVEVLQPEAPR